MACANLDKGKAAMSVCGNSCIGCGLCEKECKKDAIHVVNDVAVIDYDAVWAAEHKDEFVAQFEANIASSENLE